MKLMVVDDEPIVRYGIRTSVPWEKNGIEWVGEAENGSAALQKAAQLQPDIVLCDIHMPVMDGIAFIHALKSILPDVRIILLTGYSNQEYFMEAIRSNVSDYLLKPAGVEQLLASVLRVKAEIETEREKMGRLWRRNELFNRNLTLLREHLVTSLLNGRPDRQQLGASLKELDFSLTGPWYAVGLLTGVEERDWSPPEAFGRALAAFHPLICCDSERNTAVALINLAGSDMRASLKAVCDDCDACTRGGRRLIFSDAADGLDQLPRLYGTALELLSRKEWYPDERVLFVDHRVFTDAEPDSLADLREQLLRSIRDGYTEQAEQLAGRFFDSLAQTKPPYRAFVQRLTQIEKAVALAFGATAESAPPPESEPKKLRDWFISVCCEPEDLAVRYGGGQVGRALYYMEGHFSDDLSLESVADQLYISPTYLSRLLNEKTQIGFYGWLHRFRIHEAKKLLLEGRAKHYEIAELVGYRSYKVFCEHFQQLTGMTAKEYRTVHRKDKKVEP